MVDFVAALAVFQGERANTTGSREPANGLGWVSTRKVDDLVQAMGLSGISRRTVSKLCTDMDERVHAFLDRPLAGEWPCREWAKPGGLCL